MLTQEDTEKFNKVVDEVKSRAESFLYAGASSRRTQCTCTRTARPSEIVRCGLSPTERVHTQWSCIVSVCTEDIQGAERFWLDSDLIGAHLGSGYYSDVYQSKFNDDLVIKIGTGQGRNGDIFTDGWLTYARYCITNGPGLILPEIEAIRVQPDDGVYIALLRKYDCCLQDMGPEWNPMEVKLARAKCEAITHGLGRGCGYGSQALRHPLYTNAGTRVRHGLDRLGVQSYDLHDGNFMLTRHGRVVLTDPTASSCSEGTKDFLTSLLKEAA